MSRRKDSKFAEETSARIQALQEERLVIQKKTFTKWVNSFLVKVSQTIKSLTGPLEIHPNGDPFLFAGSNGNRGFVRRSGGRKEALKTLGNNFGRKIGQAEYWKNESTQN